MNGEISMRDSFLNQLYEFTKKDKNVVIVSADMGAPGLDQFRDNLSSQFVNVGIAEHDMIAIATGLAFEGKKPFTIAIAPFATTRCHEFVKLNLGLMKAPVNIIGIGAGFSYDDSGPTHHTTEDISIMRAIPNLVIFSPSDSKMAGAFAEIVYRFPGPKYIRLDRQVLPSLSHYYDLDNYEKGFKELESGEDIAIISTGNMVHKALEVREKMKSEGKNIGVIDLYRLKPVSHELKDILSKYKQIISLEEHLLDGGFGSIIAEVIVDNNLSVKLKRIGLKDYVYLYRRDNIQKKCEIDVDSVIGIVRGL